MTSKLTICDNLPISGKRICSIGNRGHHNFGDELILVGLILLITQEAKSAKKAKKAKKVQLFVSGGDLNFLKEFHQYFFDTQELENVSYLQEIPHGIRSGFRFLFGRNNSGRPKRASLQTIKNYLQCDTFIIGGGELFTEETPGSYLYRFWSLIPFWCRRLFFWNTKLYIMGGLQAPKAWYNKLIMKCILRYANGCFMRDEESCRDALLVCPHQKDVQWFIDTSYFAVDHTHFHNGSRSFDSAPLRSEGQRSHIIINSNPLSGKRTDELIDIAKEYDDKGYEIYFLPAFYTSNPQQDDMRVYDYLKHKIYNLQLLDRRRWDEFLIIFYSSEKVFCSRLHIFLIAAFMNIDVCPYPYQKKIKKNEAILKRCGIL